MGSVFNMLRPRHGPNRAHVLAQLWHSPGSQRRQRSKSRAVPVLAQSKSGHWRRAFARALPVLCARAPPGLFLIFLPVGMLWLPEPCQNCASTGLIVSGSQSCARTVPDVLASSWALAARAVPEPPLMFLPVVMASTVLKK